jgi:hypothetical protein
MELKYMNNIEKFVLVAVVICIGSLLFLMENTKDVEITSNTTLNSPVIAETPVEVVITPVLDEIIEETVDLAEVKEVVIKSVEVIPPFNDAFIAAREALGPNETFEWNGNLYTTNYFYEMEVAETPVEDEVQLSQEVDENSIAYNMN